MHNRGFTLIETAIILIIAGLLIGSLLVPLSVQFDISRIERTQARLTEAKQSLLTYYSIHYGRLPCPDSDTPPDGLENRNNDTSCTVPEGVLPWNNLRIDKAVDAWGHPLRYRASEFYTGAPSPNDSLRIQLDPSNPLMPYIETNNDQKPLAAIIFSQGRNGIDNHQCVPDPQATAIAIEDCYAIYAYIAKEEGMGNGIKVTDDILTWLSANELSGNSLTIVQQQDNETPDPLFRQFTPVEYGNLSR